MTKEEASIVFKALGEPNRLKIVKMLLNNDDELCACKLLGAVDCKQATLSHHLSVLKECKLLESRKSGKNIIYCINKKLLYEVNDFMRDSCEECRRLDE